MIDKKKIKQTALLAGCLNLAMCEQAAAQNDIRISWEPINEVTFQNLEVWGEPKYADEIEDAFQKMPDSLKQYYMDVGCRVVLVDGNYGAENAYESFGWQVPGSILGFATDLYCYPYSYSIFVESSDHPGYYERYPESSEGLEYDDFNYRIDISTLYHELGHLYDWNGRYSYSNEFYNIYLTEANLFTNTSEYKINNFNTYQNIVNSLEYYATAFSCYINYPEELQEYCPDTYNYFAQYIGNVSKKLSLQ